MNSRLFWFIAGIGAYWAFQHVTGMGTSGLGARKHPGGLAA